MSQPADELESPAHGFRYYLIELTDHGVNIYGPYDAEEQRDTQGVQEVRDWTNDVLALTVDPQGEIEIFPVEEPEHLGED
jgi:hypothetical protein